MQSVVDQNNLEKSKSYITELIKENVPKSDREFVDQELKKTFILDKHKSRSKQKHKKQNIKKSYSTNLQKKSCLYKIGRQSIKYVDMEPLHNLWKQYICDYLGINRYKNKVPSPDDKNWESLSSQLLKADYHGAYFTVVRSTCPSLVGQSGICVFDTKNTFVLVGKDNKTRTIPKLQSVFELELKNMKFTMFGKQFSIRPADRSTRKIKLHMVPDI